MLRATEMILSQLTNCGVFGLPFCASRACSLPCPVCGFGIPSFLKASESRSVPRNRGEVSTMIGALDVRGMRALMTVDGGTDGDVFKAFVEQVLVRKLRPGDIVVLDNVGAHKPARIRRLVEAGLDPVLGHRTRGGFELAVTIAVRETQWFGRGYFSRVRAIASSQVAPRSRCARHSSSLWHTSALLSVVNLLPFLQYSMWFPSEGCAPWCRRLNSVFSSPYFARNVAITSSVTAGSLRSGSASPFAAPGTAGGFGGALIGNG